MYSIGQIVEFEMDDCDYARKLYKRKVCKGTIVRYNPLLAPQITVQIDILSEGSIPSAILWGLQERDILRILPIDTIKKIVEG